MWVFNALKEAMSVFKLMNIMNDQDKSMKAGITQVFPQATHRCCKWHVVNKACEKLDWLINSNEDFANEFDYCINHTKTIKEFEILWSNMEDKYKLHKNDVFQNVSVARDMWAPTYFKHYIFPFTSTLGRSESVNSLFKIWCICKILCCVKQYEYIAYKR